MLIAELDGFDYDASEWSSQRGQAEDPGVLSSIGEISRTRKPLASESGNIRASEYSRPQDNRRGRQLQKIALSVCASFGRWLL